MRSWSARCARFTKSSPLRLSGDHPCDPWLIFSVNHGRTLIGVRPDRTLLRVPFVAVPSRRVKRSQPAESPAAPERHRGDRTADYAGQPGSTALHALSRLAPL